LCVAVNDLNEIGKVKVESLEFKSEFGSNLVLVYCFWSWNCLL